MKKYIRAIVLGVVILVLLGIAGPYFLEWSLDRAFEPALKKGGAVGQLKDVLEATVGSTLARGDARLRPEQSADAGALDYYGKNPQALQRDKKYFETWHSALSIADVAGKGEHQLDHWETSASAPWIAPPDRTDAWGHAFCVRSDQDQIIVLSPGPQALSSLDCNTLKIPDEKLDQMPEARLNPIGSGALILIVKKRSDSKSAPHIQGAKLPPAVTPHVPSLSF